MSITYPLLWVHGTAIHYWPWYPGQGDYPSDDSVYCTSTGYTSGYGSYPPAAVHLHPISSIATGHGSNRPQLPDHNTPAARLRSRHTSREAPAAMPWPRSIRSAFCKIFVFNNFPFSLLSLPVFTSSSTTNFLHYTFTSTSLFYLARHWASSAYATLSWALPR